MKRIICLLIASGALLVPACANDGHLCLLGYTSRPNYDTKYKTISVPMVKNRSGYVVTPTVGLEQDLHRWLVDEVQLKTPYRVVQADPDTELSVTIRGVSKNLLNYTPFNTVREAELIVVVDLIWRDVRTGQVLSRAARRPGQATDRDGDGTPRQRILNEGLLPQGPRRLGDVPERPDVVGLMDQPDDDLPADPLTRRPAVPIRLQAAGHFRPELGESTTTGLQKAMRQIAWQIVAAMETGW